MKTILITGGAGFVGSHLCEAELAAGNRVICYDLADDKKIRHLLYNDDFQYVHADILDFGLLSQYIEQCDLFYHLAAIADPAIYCNNPLKVLEVDLEGTIMAIKMAFSHGKKIVFSSTSEVYGKNPKVPWNEDADRVLGTTATHRWSYASSKALGEHYCYAFGKKGLQFTIVRFFNFYGPRLDFLGAGRVIPCFMEKFLKDEPVEVCLPGTQTRCFTYIDDGIRALMAAARNEDNTSFNIGTEDQVTMMDLAVMMKDLGGFMSDLVAIPASKKYGEGYEDIMNRAPDCSKVRAMLDWKPKVSLVDGLNKTISYYKELSCVSQ